MKIKHVIPFETQNPTLWRKEYRERKPPTPERNRPKPVKSTWVQINTFNFGLLSCCLVSYSAWFLTLKEGGKKVIETSKKAKSNHSLLAWIQRKAAYLNNFCFCRIIEEIPFYFLCFFFYCLKLFLPHFCCWYLL